MTADDTMSCDQKGPHHGTHGNLRTRLPQAAIASDCSSQLLEGLTEFQGYIIPGKWDWVVPPPPPQPLATAGGLMQAPIPSSCQADVLVQNWSRGRPAAFDICVTSSLNTLTLSEAGVCAGAAAQAGEVRKHSANNDKWVGFVSPW